jgi:hypothetical protein
MPCVGQRLDSVDRERTTFGGKRPLTTSVGVLVRSGNWDAAQVFEPAEHDLYLVALGVEPGIVQDRHFPVALRGDASGDLALCQGGATQPVS